MAKYGYEPDAFDPETVRRERERLRQMEGQSYRPDGSRATCARCRNFVPADCIPGCVCPRCGQTFVRGS